MFMYRLKGILCCLMTPLLPHGMYRGGFGVHTAAGVGPGGASLAGTPGDQPKGLQQRQQHLSYWHFTPAIPFSAVADPCFIGNSRGRGGAGHSGLAPAATSCSHLPPPASSGGIVSYGRSCDGALHIVPVDDDLLTSEAGLEPAAAHLVPRHKAAAWLPTSMQEERHALSHVPRHRQDGQLRLCCCSPSSPACHPGL